MQIKSAPSPNEKPRGGLTLVRQLWKNRVAVRALLNSENFIFARDFLPGHFYSPLPDLGQIRDNAQSIFKTSVRSIAGIDLNERHQLQVLDALSQSGRGMPFPGKAAPGFRFYLQNPYFSFGDAIVLYALLNSEKPARIVEIGSGFSSAALLDINSLCFNGSLALTFIEPNTDRLERLMLPEDERCSTLLRANVQSVPMSVFESLRENDVLLVDSSHVGKCHSDVLHILFAILPLLNKGVLVHFHDILWPFEYPQSWLEGGRAWNEAYILRAFLQYNPAFEIHFFNSYMAEHHADLFESKLPGSMQAPPHPDTRTNSSLWLRKKL